MTFLIRTTPDMLAEAYGNQTEIARRLKCSHCTVRKHVDDKNGEAYVIVNDVLMIYREQGEKDTLLRKDR